MKGYPIPVAMGKKMKVQFSHRSIWLVRIGDPDWPPVPDEHRLRVPQPRGVHRVAADQAAGGRGAALQALKIKLLFHAKEK